MAIPLLDPLPEKVRYINLYGVDFGIEWEVLLPGRSFFLKTTATAGQVMKALRPAVKHFNFELAACERCEFGYYGVRVWRLS